MKAYLINTQPTEFIKSPINENKLLNQTKNDFLSMLQVSLQELSDFSTNINLESTLLNNSNNSNNLDILNELNNLNNLNDFRNSNITFNQNYFDINNEIGGIEGIDGIEEIVRSVQSVESERIEGNKENKENNNLQKSSQEKQKHLESLIAAFGNSNYFNFDILNEKIEVNENNKHVFQNFDFLKNIKNFDDFKGFNINSNVISKEEKPSENFKNEIKNKLMNEIHYYNEITEGSNSLIHGENNIKISDESTKIKSQILTQVKDKIVFISNEGNISSTQEVTMELQPHNLGKVNIKMIFKDNELNVEIKASNEETQNILFNNKEEIANILGQKIDKTVTIQIKPSEFSHENHILNYYQNNKQASETNYNGSKNQNNHNKHKNNYYENKQGDEDVKFSELINLSNTINI